VIVRKKIVTDHQTVSGNLRSEHFEAKQIEATSAPKAAGGDYDALDVNRDARDTNGVSADEKLDAAMGTGRIGGAETRIRLHEEQLAVTKREISAGGVDICKRVQEEHVQQSVPVKREELVVERRPLTGAATDANPGAATPDEIMRFTLYREEVVLEKRRVPFEEVIVRKKLVTEEEIVNETLRSEHIEVQQLGASGGDRKSQGETGVTSITGTHDARDTNSDGHVSMGEKFKSVAGSSGTAGFYDSRDTNQDGHVSTGEKLKANSHASSFDARDANRDGYVSTGEKVQSAVATSAPAARG
jgi:uncharacterized protein (TIGR02271 family)